MRKLEGDPVDDLLGHILGLETEAHKDLTVALVFLVKNSAPSTYH